MWVKTSYRHECLSNGSSVSITWFITEVRSLFQSNSFKKSIQSSDCNFRVHWLWINWKRGKTNDSDHPQVQWHFIVLKCFSRNSTPALLIESKSIILCIMILCLLVGSFCLIFNSSFLDPETQEKSRETPHECFHEMVPTWEKEDYRTESGCS